jgi:hypothetical protein
MSALMRWVSPTEAEGRSAIAQRIADTSLTYAAAKMGMDELGHLYHAAAMDADCVLRKVEVWVSVATALQPLTPAQQAALERRTQEFLDEMLTATKDAGTEIVNALATKRKGS